MAENYVLFRYYGDVAGVRGALDQQYQDEEEWAD